MTFAYELDPYSPAIYRMCKYELVMSGLSKVIIRQTDVIKIIHRAALRVVSDMPPPHLKLFRSDSDSDLLHL